jgi:hypothetical protein
MSFSKMSGSERVGSLTFSLTWKKIRTLCYAQHETPPFKLEQVVVQWLAGAPVCSRIDKVEAVVDFAEG